MTLTVRRDEEESVFKKRLLYDGHGSGEDKRLVNILKNITKFCISDDSNEDVVKLFNVITKDLATALNSAEKQERTVQAFDRTFQNLEQSIKDKEQHIEKVKQDLVDLELELEYAAKLKTVDVYPDCQTTEHSMREIQKRRQYLITKIEKQRSNLNTLVEACKSLEKVMEGE